MTLSAYFLISKYPLIKLSFNVSRIRLELAVFVCCLQIISSEKGPVMAPVITSGVGRAVQVYHLFSQQGEMYCFCTNKFLFSKTSAENYHIKEVHNASFEVTKRNKFNFIDSVFT